MNSTVDPMALHQPKLTGIPQSTDNAEKLQPTFPSPVSKRGNESRVPTPEHDYMQKPLQRMEGNRTDREGPEWRGWSAQLDVANAAIALGRRLTDKMDRVAGKVERFTHQKGRDMMALNDVLHEQLNKALAPFFLSSRSEGLPREVRYRNADFIRVGEILHNYGKVQWSRIPRTYAILSMIGCADAIEGFISEKRTDFYLPYDAKTLPSCVKGAKARKLFLERQLWVLNSLALELEKQGGDHQYFPLSADNYFESKRELGRGLFGRVDCVMSRLSMRMYARKRIRKGQSMKKDEKAMKSFENELKTLKLLKSHPHLVKLVGSYSDNRWVGFIMTPVADCNLREYLAEGTIAKDRRICLREFFGCLSTAITFLHENTTRHRDIKPGNILVKNGRVLLADFGTSHNWSEDEKSATSATVDVMTPKYSAPELNKHVVRTPSSFTSLPLPLLSSPRLVCLS